MTEKEREKRLSRTENTRYLQSLAKNRPGVPVNWLERACWGGGKLTLHIADGEWVRCHAIIDELEADYAERDAPTPGIDEKLRWSFEQLGINERTINILQAADLWNVYDLLGVTEDELIANGLTPQSRKHVLKCLAEAGFEK